jgi:flagellar operon protein
MSNPIQNNKIGEILANRAIVQPKPTPGAGGTDFQELLSDRLKVSGHAQTRLTSRNIELDAKDWERVMNGVDRAAEKGSKESLIMLDEVALVVSVKNRTVITAVDKAQLKENVFTNIDSAVIV